MNKQYKILLRKMINSTNSYNRLINYGVCYGYLECLLDKRVISTEEYTELINELVGLYSEATFKYQESYMERK
jgi:hypothetical protein